MQSMLDPAGPAAHEIAQVWWWMAGVSLLVLGMVMVLLAGAMRRRRRRLAPRRGLWLIVGGGIALPTVLLMVLLVYGTDVARTMRTIVGSPQVIEVEARQWTWTFRYLDARGHVAAVTQDRLRMPLGRDVEFRVGARDVIHSFWIPRLGGKVDAIPGRVNSIVLRADRSGPIRGQCAEFCGLQHARMAFDVEVLPAADFERWLAAARPVDGAPR